ncbi:AbrB/MazE/SpoVT family DNA-binding domain-containing protein [Lactiplantibacillus paraplantarum]|uniref:AbrB family transcriptional regulator n=1 Tax=Lactiplantibacillus paraplantarum TaxID=60520 RepID=A0AAD0TUS0_9LACO|nr:type II toxin-antitoxin system PrlF family antitoxin [Lactiplantibacillus paraplantarum]AVW09214.1 AbrB/MazE/SpoVT family DNA-binding domain-containing protein [Lactiplantibacillus paraplantarum]AYJ37480.1 AbrB/MazE/SpoVT family DNA-binding domain-containing protein [Lactiplantibacillus paraplantarum]ERL45254.1 hypothetical protein N644_0715 [Lactiplantibacillus paraplantarum]MCU4682436.1 type II toxin-antitoxin system PrlF family antitoxin [Lactiplantibacillus paraplantarum]MDL2060801.1 ty
MSSNHTTLVSSKITSKNQVTIPKTIRELLDIGSNDTINWQINPNGTVVLAKSKPDLWQVVADQEKQFGNLSTSEIEWGPDLESDEFD